ncbi:MAG: hypothetical protein A2X61_05880 [Ignavibacteria bacterium GWB2_35_12]|nr:MAG: hypothetical protein A2X63_00715 [Ignavibacteria bacterium GWA2_35_8]OGU42280.1 MAG: hypothetical protein A2X61_05880 [Ignavibacteria bacterium GWB2_35_12]OGU93544.1 MAG: hypothetical protein A2220_13150 [Ignavibacteria bacterium RIFOXYA2_FULL_35_10]OGV22144.1 MAG: hypothetical protein A2475_05540 [Ignavibacteria bacterium RIFOXYC2_FULL_35_21]
MNTEVSKIIDNIVSKFNPDKIVVFGSYAGGLPTKDSDLDLLIIMDSILPRYKRASEIRLGCFPYSIPLDILVYTPNEYEEWRYTTNHILKEIDKSGVVIYERNS